MCHDPIDVEQMKILLHARIGKAIADKEVDKDWSSEPAPFIPTTPIPASPSHTATSGGHYGNSYYDGEDNFNSNKNSFKQKGGKGGKNQNRYKMEAIAQQKLKQRAGRFQDDHKNVKKRTMVSHL